MPRIECARCGRPIAAGPVAGRPGKGRLFRHDEPGTRQEFHGALLSCPGSLDIVDLPRVPLQLELDVVGDDQGDEQLVDAELADALF